MPDYHFLITYGNRKSRNFIDKLHKAALRIGLHCTISEEYEPCRVLVLYGYGGKAQQKAIRMHRGTLFTFDLGYWRRLGAINNRNFRFTINGFHPKCVMDGERPSAQRWNNSGFQIKTAKIRSRDIMLIGNAPKTLAIMANGWTAKKSSEIRREFKGSKIIYRPKPGRPLEKGVDYDILSQGEISLELRRAGLVVCRHSNVAVDSCIRGIPVVCDDGAAAAIYPSKLEDCKDQPCIDTRTEFLHRLAYWQWSANEAELFWQWLRKTFPAHYHR